MITCERPAVRAVRAYIAWWGAMLAVVARVVPLRWRRRFARVTGVQVWSVGASMLAAAALIGVLGGPFAVYLYLLSFGGLVAAGGAARAGTLR